jgi:hypothetical protein
MEILKRENLEEIPDWGHKENMNRLPGILASIKTAKIVVKGADAFKMAQFGYAAADEHVRAYYDNGKTNVGDVRDEAIRMVEEREYVGDTADPFLDFITEHSSVEPAAIVEHFFVDRIKNKQTLDQAA